MRNKHLYLILVLTIMFLYPNVAKAEIVNPMQVYTHDIMEKDIKTLANTYPDLISYKSIGKSEYGREIYAVSLGKGLSTSYINASNHAREWISTNLVMKMIDEYAKAYKEGQTIGAYNVKTVLDNHTIWFVPMMNPDGVTLQQLGLNSFPKADHESLIQMNHGSLDFKRWKANGKGIDLNRQFDANWGVIRNSPSGPSFANFKGTVPHQASEVKAVIHLTYEIDPEMAISYHSSGSIIFWHFLQQGFQYERDLFHAKNLSSMTGYRLAGQHSQYSGGGYTDWFTETFKKPAFTPELGTPVGPTHVPLAQFNRIWEENRLVGLYVASKSHEVYMKRLYASVTSVGLQVNGEPLVGEVEALLVQGRTLVPVRGLFEKIGADVQWHSEARVAEIKKNDMIVRLPLNSNKVTINDELVELDVPAQIIYGRLMVPVRFISEAIGAQVEWDTTTRSVLIRTP